MSYVGMISLYLAGVSTLLAIVLSTKTLRAKRDSLAKWAHRFGAVSTFFIVLATMSLIVAFLRNDFSIAYVSRHSARNLPVLYKVSALWAGQSGSLLLWVLIMSCMTATVQKMKRYQENHLYLRLGIVMHLVCLLFLVLLLFVTPVFERLVDIPYNGSGLNPMLQSLGMVFHPPLLFLGFSGFLVPFALAVVGLCTGDTQGTWLKQVRPWVLFAWLFLTAGIVTGGQWAYNELGWGGYWAWDPVENSSFFPWLTSTALLHILLLPEHHRSKRVWSYTLIALTYALTIFATFLTRSGILDSVHAFAGGVLGQVFFAVLVLLATFSLTLGVSKRHALRTAGSETTGATLVVGSVLLLMLCAGVLFGTLFPVITRTFAGREVVLDASFFNQLSVPLFLVIFFLMGIAPLVREKASDRKVLPRTLALPVLLGIAAAAYTYSLQSGLAACLAFGLAAFGFGTHLRDLFFPRSRRHWGGVLVHLGVLIVLIGVAGSSVFIDDVLVSVEPGQEITFGDYVLEYQGLRARYGSDQYTVTTTLAIMENGTEVGEITSEKTFWEGRHQPSTQVGIFSTIKEDLYLNLAGWENQTAQLHLQRFALVSWIWVGSWVMYAGALVALLKGGQVKLWSRPIR